MQIFKPEDITLLVETMRSTASTMVHILFDAGLDLLTSSISSVFASLSEHQWTAAIGGILVFVGICIFLIRIVKRNYTDLF